MGPPKLRRRLGTNAKDHVSIHDLDLTIENARGKERSGVGKDGKRWSVKTPVQFGQGNRQSVDSREISLAPN
jgi:hypothetical protein